MTAMQQDYTAIATSYLDVWNEADPDRRLAAAEAVFAPGARYVDPAMETASAPALAQAIGAVQDRFPGWRFRLDGDVDGHHDQLRFAWELGPDESPLGQAPVRGFDVLQLEDGRIVTVLGFLDRVPAAS